MRATTRHAALVTWIAGFAVLAFATGCPKKSGNTLATETRSEMADFRTDLERVDQQVRTTLEALDEVLKPGIAEPIARVEHFRSELAALEKNFEHAKDTAKDMEKRESAYFDSWTREMAKMEGEESRERAETRRTEQLLAYRRIIGLYPEMKTSFQELTTALEDIDRFLKQDFTPTGLAATRKLADDAHAAGAKLQQQVRRIAREVESVSKAISPPTPA